MKKFGLHILPEARTADLVTRRIPGELLVYDLKRHKAYCLNETAAIVFANCDGARTVRELLAELEDHHHFPIDEQIVWLALHELQKSHLLKTKSLPPSAGRTISRRRLIAVGVAGTIALPVITMIVAPTAQAAGSPITRTVCKARNQSDPGGCGGNPCSDKAGTSCIAQGKNACDCG